MIGQIWLQLDNIEKVSWKPVIVTVFLAGSLWRFCRMRWHCHCIFASVNGTVCGLDSKQALQFVWERIISKKRNLFRFLMIHLWQNNANKRKQYMQFTSVTKSWWKYAVKLWQCIHHSESNFSHLWFATQRWKLIKSLWRQKNNDMVNYWWARPSH